MIKRIIAIIILSIFSIMDCDTDRKGESWVYLEQGAVNNPDKAIINVYIDKQFSKGEVIQIESAIIQWDKVLNGNMGMIVAGDFDMEMEKIEEARVGRAYLIMKIGRDSPLIIDVPGERTLAFTNAIGGDKLYIVDGILEKDINGVVMHEIGHLLGARHTATGIMYKNYHIGEEVCIDILAVQEVGKFRGWEWGRMNYCVLRK